eukprot:g7905.t1
MAAVNAAGGQAKICTTSSVEGTDNYGESNPVELAPTQCSNKRGVAFGFQDEKDLNTLKDGLSWWYDWSPGALTDGILEASMAQNSEYVPMIWGEDDLAEGRLMNLDHDGSIAPYLLGFNEPNYGGQDPIAWLDQFFAACGDVAERDFCGITYLAVHSYTCEVRYLNKHIHMYTKYGLPIWLTEFACGFEALELNAEGQANFLKDAGTYLEMNPHIFRYAWFTVISADDDGLDNSINLLDAETKELTEAGKATTPAPVEGNAGSEEDVDDDGYASTGYHDDDDVNLFDDDDSDQDDDGSTNGSNSNSEPPPVPAAPTPAPTDSGDNGNSENSNEEETPGLVVVSEPTGGELDVDSVASVIVNAIITNVGGTGYYDDVIDMIDGEDMNCPSFDDACVKQEVCVSGDLAPFDEVSVAFRGPLNLYNIAWYEGTADETLERTTTWTRGEAGHNIAFMNNKGGLAGCAGEWSICGGNSQSFADATGVTCTDDMTNFDGNLPDDNEVNIMTGWHCASQEQCGFYRDVGMRGWTGGDDGTKVMLFEVDMPHCGESCNWNRPAVWALNARVYDFKGAGGPGTAKYFERPSERTTYAAVFRGGSEPYLQVVQLDGWDFTATTIAPSQLDSIKGSEAETHQLYDVDSRAASSSGGCGSQDDDGAGDDTEEVEVPMTLAEGYEYVGCFHDKFPLVNRDMPLTSKRKFPGNKPRMCANRCSKEEGATFFGLQNGELMSSVYVIPVEHSYVGCFTDKRGDRDMLLVPKVVSDVLTPAACAAYCSSVEGANYFGVQAGRKCFCGDSFGRHGESTLCAEPCSGDEDQVCGAHNVNSVYTFLPLDEVKRHPSDAALGDQQAVCGEDGRCGCFLNESLEGRSLMRGGKYGDSENLSRGSCKAECEKDGFPFYGLEWSILCYCGGTQTRKDDFIDGIAEFRLADATMACSMPCPVGDAADTCGGSGAIEIWEV